MKVFIDTGAFIAYFVRQEAWHKEVVDKYNYYRHQKAVFITSNYIMDELLTWFGRNQNKILTEKLMLLLQRSVENGELNILYIDRTIHKKSQGAFLKFFDHQISFTGATTFFLYKDFKLDEVFTLDSDFKKIGVNTSF